MPAKDACHFPTSSWRPSYTFGTVKASGKVEPSSSIKSVCAGKPIWIFSIGTSEDETQFVTVQVFTAAVVKGAMNPEASKRLITPSHV